METKKLKAEDYYFYNNGTTHLTTKFDLDTGQYYTDLEYCCRAIRVFGTPEEIDNAVNEYCEKFDLTIDECYDYKVEPKGSYWYNLGIITDEQNEIIAKKLVKYNELYNQKGRKALILRTR